MAQFNLSAVYWAEKLSLTHAYLRGSGGPPCLRYASCVVRCALFLEGPYLAAWIFAYIMSRPVDMEVLWVALEAKMLV